VTRPEWHADEDIDAMHAPARRQRNGVQPHRIVLGSRIPRLLGHDAFTFAIWTFVAAPWCSAELRAHENRHVFQAKRVLFVCFWIAYLLEFGIRIVVALIRGPRRSAIAHAYKRVSWERDAYDWARRHAVEFDAIGSAR
jgi:hypothetical protein